MFVWVVLGDIFESILDRVNLNEETLSFGSISINSVILLFCRRSSFLSFGPPIWNP